MPRREEGLRHLEVPCAVHDDVPLGLRADGLPLGHRLPQRLPRPAQDSPVSRVLAHHGAQLVVPARAADVFGEPKPPLEVFAGAQLEVCELARVGIIASLVMAAAAGAVAAAAAAAAGVCPRRVAAAVDVLPHLPKSPPTKNITPPPSNIARFLRLIWARALASFADGHGDPNSACITASERLVCAP